MYSRESKSWINKEITVEFPCQPGQFQFPEDIDVNIQDPVNRQLKKKVTGYNSELLDMVRASQQAHRD